MVAQEEIQKWLTGKRGYRSGVLLYVKYGSSEVFKKSLLSEPESAFKRSRLLQQLETILRKPIAKEAKGPDETVKEVTAPPGKLHTPLKSESAPVANDNTKAKETAPKTWSRTDCRDDYELTLWERASLLLKQIASLHAQLSASFSDYERRTYAFDLLRKDDELDDIYEKRDYYRATKQKKSEDHTQLITDPFLMAKRLTNLTRYIRRERLHNNQKGETEERNQKIAAYIAEYNAYAKKLNRSPYA